MQKSFVHPISICMLIACISIASCTTPQDVVYFQNLSRDTTLNSFVSRDFDFKIRPDDILYIGITSASLEENIKFNSPQIQTTANNSVNTTTMGYLVDKNGHIQIYKLGNVYVQGLTRKEVKEKLQKDLLDYLKDPVVTVRFLNHRISVLGEVNKPQVFTLQNDQVTVLEALALSGDLTAFGRRDNILVIRQTDKGKEFKRLNLLDNSIFTSPYYYLQNDDVVYVEPNLKAKNGQKQQVVSYVISGASLLFLIIDRIVR